jgi:hypothetical protein
MHVLHHWEEHRKARSPYSENQRLGHRASNVSPWYENLTHSPWIFIMASTNFDHITKSKEKNTGACSYYRDYCKGKFGRVAKHRSRTKDSWDYFIVKPFRIKWAEVAQEIYRNSWSILAREVKQDERVWEAELAGLRKDSEQQSHHWKFKADIGHGRLCGWESETEACVHDLGCCANLLRGLCPLSAIAVR